MTPACKISFGLFDFFCSVYKTSHIHIFLLHPAAGEHQSPHVPVCHSQPALQQIQEPTGQHHALRKHPRLPPANQRPGGLRLHQRQLHRRIQVYLHPVNINMT